MKILGKRNSYLKTEKQKKETTGKFIITKNGSSKKNILERSFQKANLRFTRLSVRGKEKVGNELGFAFKAVNLKKCIAMNRNRQKITKVILRKMGSIIKDRTHFYLFLAF